MDRDTKRRELDKALKERQLAFEGWVNHAWRFMLACAPPAPARGAVRSIAQRL